MNCKTIDQKLIFYFEGELSAQENKLIEQHIENCSSCAAKLEYLRETLSILNTEKEAEVKPFLYTRIQGKMTVHPKVTKQWALASIMVTSVLFIGLFFGSMVGKLSIPTEYSSNDNYTVSYLFDDMQMESMEYKLLND